MKTFNFLIFFAIVFTIYGLLNYYIFIRGWQAIPRGSVIRTYYLIGFLLVALSFFLGRFLEGRIPVILSDIFIWVGSFWLGAILYFFLIILALDLFRLINHFLPFFPAFITGHYTSAKQVIAISATALIAIAMLIGYFNAANIRVKTLSLRIPKSANGLKTLSIVSASDIHLGTIIGRSRLDKLVEKINSLNPDIVLLPGDVVDEDLKPVIRQNLGESLKNIKAPLGVYAITGNHEYIGGVEPACRYLEEHNINFLRDSVLKINNCFYLIGREDREKARFTGTKRKQLDELLLAVDKIYPIILLDHQPFGLAQVAGSGVDLQISGHTHNGQLWPLNYVTELIYEISWGYEQIGNSHFYVSSGAGTWGPPMRLGNSPEIVNFKLTFK